MIGGNNSFGKTICSICYEDLNPIIEDLQSISICGHVFHEICLHQWFEYCTNGKKKNCPVCKQACSEQNANRLYFQSVGDPNDTSLTKKPCDHEEDPRELRNEVKRLEGKVLLLTSTLEKQLKDLKDVNAELFTCKEELKIEATLKNEAVKQEAAIQQLLHLKSKELDRSTLECIRLKDGNMALDKDLAALKLSYKELMTKCDTHGRREARSLRKLEKSKAKINKLKTRVQELETALEEKEKYIENLTTLRASKKNFELYQGSKGPKVDRCSYENQNKAPAETEVDLCMVTGSCNDLSTTRRKRKCKSNDKSIKNTTEDIIAGCLHKNSHEKDSSIRNNDGGTSETASYAQGSENRDGVSGSRNSPVIILDDDTDLPPLDDVTQHQPSFRIRKETSAPVILAQPGDSCFSGGLLGPDGTYWHLGKWCKKVKEKGSGSLS